ncbi:MAG TPA: hypothetical protein VNP98_02230 [Chthoniobacterales bacterium]|nr:hypothetical protein [Chthoniobacterales bacterium]
MLFALDGIKLFHRLIQLGPQLRDRCGRRNATGGGFALSVLDPLLQLCDLRYADAVVSQVENPLETMKTARGIG